MLWLILSWPLTFAGITIAQYFSFNICFDTIPLLKQLSKLTLILLFVSLGFNYESSFIFESVGRRFSLDVFIVVVLVVFCLVVLFSKKKIEHTKKQVFLSREQTEEWKGKLSFFFTTN